MAEQIIGTMIMIAVVILAIVIVFIFGKPIIEKATITGKIGEAETALRAIENNIGEVVREGPGSSRTFLVKFPNEAMLLNKESAIQFSISSSIQVFDYLSRSFVTENIIRISERGVTCTSSENLVMENSLIRVEMQRVDESQPLTSIDTKNNIKSMKIKETGETIYPVDSSVFIDIYPESSSGAGYSELLAQGAQPVCTAHFFVDSVFDYDIYYKLYSGADFLVVEVRNIEQT